MYVQGITKAMLHDPSNMVTDIISSPCAAERKRASNRVRRARDVPVNVSLRSICELMGIYVYDHLSLFLGLLSERCFMEKDRSKAYRSSSGARRGEF